MWKDYFYLRKAEKQGILVLTTLVIAVFVANLLLARNGDTANEMSMAKRDSLKKEYLTFKQSLEAKKEKKKNYAPVKNNKQKVATPKDSVPNYIKVKRHSYPRTEKYPEGTTVDLNRTDTTELKKIRGIGSYIAKRIITYRKQLGGFFSIGQLDEIDLDAEALSKWFIIDEEAITHINLNTASVERLKRHPYFNFYQAKAIVEYRKKNGPLKSLRPFELMDEFTEKDLERMKHYACFE